MDTNEIERLTLALYARAHEIYGSDCLSAWLGFSRGCDGPSWRTHICLLGRDSIFEDGPTPQASYDATMQIMRRDTVDNLALILGIEMAAA